MLDVIIVTDTLHGHLAVCSTMKVAKASLEYSYHKAADKPRLHSESYEETVYYLPLNIITLKRCIVQEEIEHL
jgi:hypothetical protein